MAAALPLGPPLPGHGNVHSVILGVSLVPPPALMAGLGNFTLVPAHSCLKLPNRWPQEPGHFPVIRLGPSFWCDMGGPAKLCIFHRGWLGVKILPDDRWRVNGLVCRLVSLAESAATVARATPITYRKPMSLFAVDEDTRRRFRLARSSRTTQLWCCIDLHMSARSAVVFHVWEPTL
jgi:hypothetical protein